MNERGNFTITQPGSRGTRLFPRVIRGASNGDVLAAAGPIQDDQTPEPELLTDAQLAQRWQLSRGTLANQRSQGRGPVYLKIAGRVRYRRSAIEAYERAATVQKAGSGSSLTPREAIEVLIRSAST